MKKDTIFSKNVIAKGKLISKNNLNIYGKFEGEIMTTQNVTINKDGVVKSTLRAKNVMVAGDFEGNIVANENIIVSETGKIRGKMASSNIKISKGASTLGKISINNNQKENISNKDLKNSG